MSNQLRLVLTILGSRCLPYLVVPRHCLLRSSDLGDTEHLDHATGPFAGDFGMGILGAEKLSLYLEVSVQTVALSLSLGHKLLKVGLSHVQVGV